MKRQLLLLGALLLVPALCLAGGLTEAEKRGKRIYLEGVGRKPIGAVLLGPGIKGPGKTFPCVNCHQADGKGTKEGGVRSADISYFNLTKEYGGLRASGRSHPAYSDETLGRAVTSCVDPAGNELNRAHPCYEMDGDDLSDLIAYMKVLGREPVPGVTGDEIRIGALLPASGPLAEAAADVRQFLSGYFSALNERGGLYSRKVAFAPVLFDPTKPGAAAEAARSVVAAEELFCLVANLGFSPNDEAARVLAQGKVPVVAPLVVLPESARWTDRTTFYIYASIRDQARVMVDFLADDPKGARKTALLHASDPVGEGGASGAREQMEKRTIAVAAEGAFPPGKIDAAAEAARLKSASVGTVLFLGGAADALAFIEGADRIAWRPRMVALASLAGDLYASVSPEWAANLFLVTPAGSPDPASRGMADFLALAAKHAGTGRHKPFLVTAYAGAMLVEKGLTAPGRSVTRDTFVDALGRLYEFRTGVTPALTYNANRREGARGAAVLKMDAGTRRLVTAAPWREPR